MSGGGEKKKENQNDHKMESEKHYEENYNIENWYEYKQKWFDEKRWTMDRRKNKFSMAKYVREKKERKRNNESLCSEQLGRLLTLMLIWQPV